MTVSTECKKHNWKYQNHDYLRECKICEEREVLTWVQVPPGAIIRFD